MINTLPAFSILNIVHMIAVSIIVIVLFTPQKTVSTYRSKYLKVYIIASMFAIGIPLFEIIKGHL